MRDLRALYTCIAVAVLVGPAHAQDLSNREIQDYVNSRCFDKHSEYRDREVILTMTLTAEQRSGVADARKAAPDHWKSPGCIIERSHFKYDESIGEIFVQYIYPLSGVDVSPGGDAIFINCRGGAKCIGGFEKKTRNGVIESSETRIGGFISCTSNSSAIVRAVQTWADQNVKEQYRDPFAE